MSGQPTRAGWAERVPGEWRGFAAFLRNPVLPDRARISLLGSARALPPLFVLDMLLMAVVLGGIGVATALGLKLPEHMLNELQLSPGLIAFIVIGAPIAEEALFRGWLSGRPGHIVGSLLLICAVVSMMINTVGAVVAGESASVALVLAALGCVLSAALATFLLRRRGALAGFQRHFRWFYYASALLFAAIHLTNFSAGGISPTFLPLVLPQLMLGLVLGYVRVNYGLFTGAALHMLHNAAFAGLMLLGAS